MIKTLRAIVAEIRIFIAEVLLLIIVYIAPEDHIDGKRLMRLIDKYSLEVSE